MNSGIVEKRPQVGLEISGLLSLRCSEDEVECPVAILPFASGSLAAVIEQVNSLAHVGISLLQVKGVRLGRNAMPGAVGSSCVRLARNNGRSSLAVGRANLEKSAPHLLVIQKVVVGAATYDSRLRERNAACECLK